MVLAAVWEVVEKFMLRSAQLRAGPKAALS
jgi:hypothetical protein